MSQKGTNKPIEQLAAVIAAYIKSTAELDERRAKEADKRAAEAEKRDKAADKRMKDLETHMKETNKRYGSTARNTGSVTEEKFFQALKTQKHIGNIAFDGIERNKHHTDMPSGYSVELDIIMHNGIYSLIIEVKYLCHCNDVQKFNEKMHKMHTYLSKIFYSRKLLFGMAANKFNDDAIKCARKHGMILFHPDGQKVRTDTSGCTLIHPDTSA